MRRFRGRRSLGALAVALVLGATAGGAYATHNTGFKEEGIHFCYKLKTGEPRVVQDPAQCTDKEGFVDLAAFDQLENTAQFIRPLSYESFLADEWEPGDEGENQVAIPPIGDEGELGLIHELALLPEDLSADHKWVLSADLTLANPPNQPPALVVCKWPEQSGGTWTTLPATDGPTPFPTGDYHVPVHLSEVGSAVPGEDEGVFRLYCGTLGDAEGVYAHTIRLFATRAFSPNFPEEE